MNLIEFAILFKEVFMGFLKDSIDDMSGNQVNQNIFLARLVFISNYINKIKHLDELKDKSPIWRFLLALAEGPSGP